jgi:hypothetical protein
MKWLERLPTACLCMSCLHLCVCVCVCVCIYVCINVQTKEGNITSIHVLYRNNSSFIQHTHTFTHTHSLTHSLTNKQAQTNTDARTHMHTHARTHAHTRTHAHARTHARMHARTHTHTQTHTHMHMHTRTHAQKDAQTHTHTHTRIILSIIHKNIAKRSAPQVLRKRRFWQQQQLMSRQTNFPRNTPQVRLRLLGVPQEYKGAPVYALHDATPRCKHLWIEFEVLVEIAQERSGFSQPVEALVFVFV